MAKFCLLLVLILALCALTCSIDARDISLGKGTSSKGKISLKATPLSSSSKGKVGSKKTTSPSSSKGKAGTKKTTTTSYGPAIKLLYQNDADWARAASPSTRQTSYLLYTVPQAGTNVAPTCSSLNETAADVASTVDPGLVKQLEYLISDGSYSNGSTFWVKTQPNTNSSYCTSVVATTTGASLANQLCSTSLPVLCSNSAPRSTSSAAYRNATYAIPVNGFTAYRDAFSFRFLQVPYANTPTRFAASTVYVPAAGKAVPGQSPQCPQIGGVNTTHWEDCLVANIYTSVIATSSTNFALRPIIMYIHGGGFTSGSGLDPTFDGGSMASRGDVVVVTPNYRLGSLGFLSINNAASGNYALSDMITCLKWIKANAAIFGGDPNKITIVGQSAGAQAIEALLASPSAAGLFSGAIVQSGRPADVANQRQTAAVAQAGAGAATLKSLGCANNTNVLPCLRALSTSKFLTSTVFNVPVVDGNIVTQPNIDVAQRRGGKVNKVPVIIGFMRDEMGSLGYAPPTSQTNLDAALTTGGISASNRTIVEKNANGLFPINQTPTGIQNLTVTVETDVTSISRCGQESTMKSAATTGVFNGIWGYTQDQRSYQINNYDPYGVCSSTTTATSGYYFCHSGDLLPVFNTAGYTASFPVRDPDDIVHSALMMDYWTSFARNGNPNPPASYLALRGYTTTASRTSSNQWNPITTSNLDFLSIGPYPTMQPLGVRGAQCSALGLPIDYIAQGGYYKS